MARSVVIYKESRLDTLNQRIDLTYPSKIWPVSFGIQRGKPTMWFRCEDNETPPIPEKRTFMVVFTGFYIFLDEDNEEANFIGTASDEEGFMYHLFEIIDFRGK